MTFLTSQNHALKNFGPAFCSPTQIHNCSKGFRNTFHQQRLVVFAYIFSSHLFFICSIFMFKIETCVTQCDFVLRCSFSGIQFWNSHS